MSIDIFFQRFTGDETGDGGAAEMRAVLAPHVRSENDGVLVVEFGDGEMDVYLHHNGMMANHVSGEDLWDLLFDGATAAGWVIMPVGCKTCVTDVAQVQDLPAELVTAGVVQVSCGADLLAVIRSL